jgi:hypothetical protein
LELASKKPVATENEAKYNSCFEFRSKVVEALWRNEFRIFGVLKHPPRCAVRWRL